MNQSNLKNRRYNEIDTLKGIGIILVIVGHSFPDASLTGGISNELCRIIYNVIYSFHMPLFFFASGFFAKILASKSEKKSQIFKKIKRLIVPYISWAIIYIPFRIVLNNFSSQNFKLADLWKILIGFNPYSGLWFLYALFVIMCIQYLLIGSKKRLLIVFLLSIFALTINQYVFITEPFCWIPRYMFYYLLGMYAKIYWPIMTKWFNMIYLVPSIILYSVIFNFTYSNGFMNNGVNRILLSILGIYIVLIFAYFFRYSLFFRYLGKNSMNIYILSGPILVMLRIILYKILRISYGVYVCIAIVSALFFSIFLSMLVEKSKKIKRFVFGSN